MQSIKIAQHLPIYNKKHHKTCGVFCLARLKGLEPPTYWFVASHSIQLSYKRRCYCSADGICIAISFTIITSKKSFVKGFGKVF